MESPLFSLHIKAMFGAFLCLYNNKCFRNCCVCITYYFIENKTHKTGNNLAMKLFLTMQTTSHILQTTLSQEEADLMNYKITRNWKDP